MSTVTLGLILDGALAAVLIAWALLYRRDCGAGTQALTTALGEIHRHSQAMLNAQKEFYIGKLALMDKRNAFLASQVVAAGVAKGRRRSKQEPKQEQPAPQTQRLPQELFSGNGESGPEQPASRMSGFE